MNATIVCAFEVFVVYVKLLAWWDGGVGYDGTNFSMVVELTILDVLFSQSGVGFKFGPVVGEILASLALNKEPALDHSQFSVGRFLLSKPRI